MRVLIHSIPSDLHTVAVQALLCRLGHDADVWYARNFPSDQTISVRIDNTGHGLSIGDQLCQTDLNGSYDVVWNRRREKFQSAGDLVEDMDKEFVSKEIRRFLTAAQPLVGNAGFWVNDEARSAAANNKLLQLKVARTIGFKVPDTLASNSATDIRAFVREQKKAIYKPMSGYSWDDENLCLYTSAVTLGDLEKGDLLQACPGIYQQYIEKSFEVRAIVMGNHVSACAIHARDRIDWRFDQQTGKLDCSYYELPLAVKERCVALIKTLGLVFGCIDLIVTPDGEHVFLENNEAGQFIWMENRVPELHVLDQFVQFLISADPDFTYTRTKTPVTYPEIRGSAEFDLAWSKNRRAIFKQDNKRQPA